MTLVYTYEIITIKILNYITIKIVNIAITLKTCLGIFYNPSQPSLTSFLIDYGFLFIQFKILSHFSFDFFFDSFRYVVLQFLKIWKFFRDLSFAGFLFNSTMIKEYVLSNLNPLKCIETLCCRIWSILVNELERNVSPILVRWHTL